METTIARRTVSLSLFGLTTSAAVGTGPIRRARAADLAQPTGKAILTISGKISKTNKDAAAEFDLPMLEAIGMESFTTTTPWYNGPVKFEGVRMMRLLDLVGASGTTVTAMALNDYSSEIPIEDFRKYPVILAIKRDGEYMPVKDKGPLFIVYPYDSDPELKHQRFYSRSAWQVARLIVK